MTVAFFLLAAAALGFAAAVALGLAAAAGALLAVFNAIAGRGDTAILRLFCRQTVERTAIRHTHLCTTYDT